MSNQPYHIETLKAYLAGKLDGKSMHEIEKRALEDPFLADALEGLSQEPESAVEGLEELQQRLQLRVVATSEAPHSQARKAVSYRKNWWLAAAAILVLALGSVYVFRMQSGGNSGAGGQRDITGDVVKNAATPSPSTGLAILQDSLTQGHTSSEKPSSGTAGSTASKSETSLADAKVAVPQPTQRQQPKEATVPVESEALVRSETAMSGVGKPIALLPEGKRPMMATARKEQSASATDEKERIAAGTQQTAIIRPDSAVPVAAQSAQVSPTAVNADSGAGAETALAMASTLQGKAAGVSVQGGANVPLNDVAVLGYGKVSGRQKRMSHKAAGGSRQNIHPVGGLEAYDSYILHQIQLWKARNTPNKDTGTVILQFRIPESGLGKPIDLKVLKGAGRKLNKRAIKLLQGGAAWQADAGILPPFTGRYTIRFD